MSNPLTVLNLRHSLSLYNDNELAYIEVPQLNYFTSSEDARALTMHKYKGFLEVKHLYFSNIHNDEFFIIPDGVRYDANFTVEVKLIKRSN